MIESHLPALQVLIPLICAPLCLLFNNGRIAGILSIAAIWCSFLLAIFLFNQTLVVGQIFYEFGGWTAPYGIEYRIDIINGFVLLLVAGISAVIFPYSLKISIKEIYREQLHLFYALSNLLVAGLFGIIITGDIFNVFVFLEISSLASYALVSLGRDPYATTSAFRYLILGTIGATFILIGVGLIYATTGTLNMADIAVRVQGQFHNKAILAAFAFLTVGIGLKAALFPLHSWLPGAYSTAPTAVAALLAATSTKVSIYLFLRFVFLFGPAFIYQDLPLSEAITILALMGILVGSATALYQSDIKKILAYSSVAHVGYIILGIGLGDILGLTGSIVHIFNHAIAKCAAFMAVGCLVYRIGSSNINDIEGIGKRMPWTMAAFVVASLSLIGIPLTAGFIGKWYLVISAFEQGWWWVLLSLLLAGSLSVIYLWRIIEKAYFSDSNPQPLTVKEPPLLMLVPLLMVAAASIYFGISTTFSAGIAAQGAAAILGVSL